MDLLRTMHYQSGKRQTELCYYCSGVQNWPLGIGKSRLRWSVGFNEGGKYM